MEASATKQVSNGGVTVAGLALISIVPTDCIGNPWNPNSMAPETFAKVKRSITEHGFIDPVTVRDMGDGTYQVVDGEHRSKAAEELGLTSIPAVNLGRISDQKAKKLTIIYNELRGNPDPNDLAALMADLVREQSVAELALDLPMSEAEIDALVKSTQPFEFDTPDAEGVLGAGQTNGSAHGVRHEEKRVELGHVKGVVPVRLANALMQEYEASAAAVGSRGVEKVLEDWLERLQRAPSQAAPPALVAGPEKRAKKAKKKAE